MRRRTASAVLATLIAVTFATSGLLHSLIPHNDTHALVDAAAQCASIYGYGHCPKDFHPTSDSHESALWSFIHSALSHEEKKTMLAPMAMYADIALLLALLFLIGTFAPRARSQSLAYERQLARGVFAYRKFR